jgi:hypothetical protein
MPSAGLIGAGAGMINALAAVELAETGDVPRATRIAGEQTLTSKLFSSPASSARVAALMRQSPQARFKNVLRSTADGETIMWGSLNSDTIMWGSLTSNTIMWGSSADGDVIVWGTATDGDVIVWGTSADGDVIVWGTSADGDVIVWGTAVDADTIMWGTALTE